jgi:hypothetical protein
LPLPLPTEKCNSWGAWWATARAAAVALVIPAGLGTLALVSPEWLDGLPRLCLWRHLFGAWCPACGTLHALCCLAHGDPASALLHNRNVLLVAPLLLGVWLGQLRTFCRSWRGPFTPTSAPRAAAGPGRKSARRRDGAG